MFSFKSVSKECFFVRTQVKDFNVKVAHSKTWCHTIYLGTKHQVPYAKNIMSTRKRNTTHLVIKALVNNIFCIKLYKEL